MSGFRFENENNGKSAISASVSNASFYWRQGRWFMALQGRGHARPLSQGMGRVLSRLKSEGKLHEGAAGCFRMSAGTTGPIINDFESPLLRLAALRNADGSAYLDNALLAAGERLRRDFETSCLSQRVTASYGESSGTADRHWQCGDNATSRLTDAALAGRQQLHAAMDAVGPELSGILFDVCCMASGLEQAELRLDLPRRAGKAVLLLALTRLARHYGLKARHSAKRPSNIGHWALEDFRPMAFPAAQAAGPRSASHQP